LPEFLNLEKQGCIEESVSRRRRKERKGKERKEGKERRKGKKERKEVLF